jgi:hypothetical protein
VEGLENTDDREHRTVYLVTDHLLLEADEPGVQLDGTLTLTIQLVLRLLPKSVGGDLDSDNSTGLVAASDRRRARTHAHRIQLAPKRLHDSAALSCRRCAGSAAGLCTLRPRCLPIACAECYERRQVLPRRIFGFQRPRLPRACQHCSRLGQRTALPRILENMNTPPKVYSRDAHVSRGVFKHQTAKRPSV